jgi:hypothetical protein
VTNHFDQNGMLRFHAFGPEEHHYLILGNLSGESSRDLSRENRGRAFDHGTDLLLFLWIMSA